MQCCYVFFMYLFQTNDNYYYLPEILNDYKTGYYSNNHWLIARFFRMK